MKFNKLLSIITVLFLTLITVTTFAQDKVIDQIVAIVGGNIVLKSDIEKMYMDQQAQGISSDGDMKCEILENFLIDKLLIAEAEMDTLINVTDSQVNQQMDGQLQMYVAHFGSERAVENFFKKPIADIRAEMRQVARDQLMSSQMRNKIIQDVTVTPSEVRQFYRNLPEEEIPVIPTQYEYSQITLRPEVSLEEENRIKSALRELKAKIEAGSSFAAMAVMYSEGPSANAGGEIGYLGRAQLDPEYAAAAFNLKGDRISNVVKSDFGYHIIQLIDRRVDKVNTRHILMTPKVSPEAKEQAQHRLDSLANLIRKEKITFQEAATRYSSDKNSRANGGLVINPNNLTSKFTVEELGGTVSKVLSGLKIGEISDPFVMTDPENRQQVYAVVKLINKMESHKANLQNDYQELSNLFLQKKREEKLEQWISSRQHQTYIRIDDTYANCNFEFSNWKK